ncbi:hypothetical protein PFISCL1PPCAC_19819, partial [Pristionchus fissidentatus]
RYQKLETMVEATGQENDVNEKIVHQLEYYFGNINLPRDKFLQEKMKSDEGWIPLAIMTTFNRLKVLCEDVEKIAEAVSSVPSDILQLSEDKLKIRRNISNALPENSLEYWQKIKNRTVYMKGFPVDTKLDDIMKFAAKFGNTENVLMRRVKTERTFKGSCFVTYKTREEAEAAQKSDSKFDEVELSKMMQEDYWALKQKETKEAKAVAQAAKRAKADEEHTAKKAPKPVHFEKGLVLSLHNIPEDATIAKIKEILAPHGPVGYVVHEAGSKEAQIRFHGEADGARKAWEKANEAAKLKMGENELEGRVLEGEEEEKYWSDFNEQKARRNESSRGRGGGRGGRGGRGRGGKNFRGGKRRNDGDDCGQQPKKKVFGDGE